MRELTKSSKVSQFRRIVGHGAHNPVRGRLPHGIQETTENVQPDPRNVAMAEDIEFVIRIRR